MSNKKSDNSILTGIIGGIVAAWFNNSLQTRKLEIDEWESKEPFDDFSSAYERKLDGYKIVFDINETIIKQKYINLIKDDEHLYTVCVSNNIMKEAIKYHMESSLNWNLIDVYIEHYFNSVKHSGIVRFRNCIPKYWIYSIQQDDNYIIINISNTKKEEYEYNQINLKTRNSNKVWDRFTCQDKEEVFQLGKEMKKYYHNYFERVVILDEVEVDDSQSDMDDGENYKIISKILPNYINIIKMIKEINNPKYNEIGKILENSNYESNNYLIYTIFSLGIQLYFDGYYNNVEYVFESILQVNNNVLTEIEILSEIHENLMETYIELKREKQINSFIETIFRDDYYNLSRIADKLYDSGLTELATKAYSIICKNTDKLIGNVTVDLFKAYLRTENDTGIQELRKKLVENGRDTWYIDRYFSDNDPDGLIIKIDRCEKEEKWEQLINYCNKYNKLIRRNSRDGMGKVIEYEFKKIEAFTRLNRYKDAWFSCCKSRRTILSSFKDVEYFKHLSTVEDYMFDLCLLQDYSIDAMFHYVLKVVYNDVYEFYTTQKSHPRWNPDLLIVDIVEKGSINECWSKIESAIIDEYKDFSSTILKNINKIMIEYLEAHNYRLQLDEPKKYFPITLSHDFSI